MFLAVATVLLQISLVPQKFIPADLARTTSAPQPVASATVSGNTSADEAQDAGYSAPVATLPAANDSLKPTVTFGMWFPTPATPRTNVLTASAAAPALPSSPSPAPVSSPIVASAMPAPAFVAPAIVASSKLPSTVTVDEARAERNRRRLWLGLAILQSSAATFDAATTRAVISSGAGVEENPTLKPFAGNASMYVAIQVGPVVLDYLGRHMMHSENRWVRGAWWVPQVAGTAMSLFGGVHNLGVLHSN